MIPFELFLIIWNQSQQQATPSHHLKIASWLNYKWQKGKKDLLLMAFRGAGKSTIVALFIAYLIYQNPNLRILVLSAETSLSRKMVRNIKRIIERHPLCVSLKPQRLLQWASERFTVNRTTELRDPTVLAKGITSNITGARADIIVCDDVEVPNTCNSVDKRFELRQKLCEISYILTPGGTQLYVGTPHSYYTIYAQTPRHEIDEDDVFLSGFDRLVLPIQDKIGNSAWPEKFTITDIERIKTLTGPNKFKSQMMLCPVNITESRLDPDLLRYYEARLVYKEVHQKPTLFLGEQKLVSCAAWWDPAFTGAKDASVLAIVFGDEEGCKYLHHIAYVQTHTDSELDEATQQCREISQILKRFFVPSVHVETNGIGAFLPNILRRELRQCGYGAAVVEMHASQSKVTRILEGFDALLAAQRLYIHEEVKATPFLQEMREWVPGKSTGRDDGLDAVAGALNLDPVRLKPIGQSRAESRHGLDWKPGHTPKEAKADFSVFET